MSLVPGSHADILESTALASLALVKTDGTPQVTPLWFDCEGDLIVVNTARGRVKDKILSRLPKVALAIVDPTNAYRYIQIQGTVVECSEEGADDVIDRLSMKYLGKKYPFRQPGEVRVTFKIRPERVQTMG